MPEADDAVAVRGGKHEEEPKRSPQPGRESRRVPQLRVPRFELPDDPGSPLWPLALVAIAVGFNLLALRDEVLPALNLNDTSAHLSMVRWANDRIRDGHLTLDGWYPYLGLGSSVFHHYQSLPHTFTGYLSLIIGPERAVPGLLYALLAWWPVSVYLGARLMGLGRWASAISALAAPLVVSFPGYGFEHGSYTWRGLGIWPQLWAMWMLPIAWGLSWRAVSGHRSPGYGVAALAVGLATAFHFLTGVLALAALGVWVLVRPSEWRRRLGRTALVGVGALLLISWVVVPLLLDARWANQSAYLRGTFWFDSFGAGQVLSWLGSGELFDASRFPVLTVLAGVGAVVCIGRWRRDEWARGLLLLMVVSLLLFSGRPTLGPILQLIPGTDDLFFHRFIQGVHLAGIMLAGVGGAWLAGLAFGLLKRFATGRRLALAGAAAGVLGIALLAPAWTERWAFDRQGGAWIHEQRDYDATEGTVIQSFIEQAYARGPGRIYAGMSGSWGSDYTVGFVPMYSVLLENDADAIGFPFRTAYLSLSTDIEVLFDETNPAHYDLFNVRYMILPVDRPPAVEATQLDERFGHTLWEVETSGYLEVVDTVSSIEADRTNLGAQTAGFLASEDPALGRFPTIAFDGEPAAPPTLPAGAVTEGRPAGSVTSETPELADGVVRGQVQLERPAMVVLKSSFDPRWVVEVDGTELPPEMVAPSYVGRTLPPGEHTVVFRYEPFPRYDLLLGIGVLTFVSLQFGPRWLRKRRGGGGPGAAGPPTERPEADSPKVATSDVEPSDVEPSDVEPSDVEPTRRSGSTATSLASGPVMIRSMATSRRGITLGLVFALLAGTLIVGFAIKAPCVIGDSLEGGSYYLCYTDLLTLREAQQLTGDRLPYLDPCVELGSDPCDEYPVLTIWTMRIVAFVAGDSNDGFVFLNMAILVLAASWVAVSLFRMVGRRALYFVLAPTLALYWMNNWDLVAVAFATAATLAYLRGRDGPSGVLLGLGAAAKIYPALLVIPFLAGRFRAGERDRGIRIAVAAAGTWIAVNLPFALAGTQGWWEFFRFSSERPASWNSLWYVACELATGAGCTNTPTINIASAVAFVVSVALVWHLKAKRDPDFPRWTLGFPILVLFLLSNKVFSPQFGLWLLPWFALVLPNLRLFLAFQLIDIGIYVTEFSWLATGVDVGGPVGLPYGAFELFAFARAVVLVLCLRDWVQRKSEQPIAALAGVDAGTVAAPPGRRGLGRARLSGG